MKRGLGVCVILVLALAVQSFAAGDYEMIESIWESPALTVGDSISVQVLGDKHRITLTDIQGSEVTFDVSSAERFSLMDGGFRYIDLYRDDLDDLRLEVLSVEGSKVYLDVERLQSKELPVTVASDKPKDAVSDTKNLKLIFLLIAVTLLFLALIVFFIKRTPEIDHKKLHARIERIKKEHG